jgi:hypothetical protein
MAPSSRVSDSSSDDGSVAPATSSQIQGISIRHHVPVILELEEGNFGQWCHFFESALGKFGLEDHITTTAPDDVRNREWRRIDSCVVNWILATVSKGVYDIVRREPVTTTTPSPSSTPSRASSATTSCSVPSSSRPSYALSNKMTCR